jgi:hypothetical protein
MLAKSEPSTLIDAFRRPALALHVSRIFEDLDYGHRVLRYELYDKTGKLTFTSGRAGLELEKPIPSVPQVSPGADANVALHNRSDAAVSHVAVPTILVHMAGQPDATLLVYLDQSEQAVILSRCFGQIAAITMLLLGAGVATPIALAWMRDQERQLAGAGALSPEPRPADRPSQPRGVQRDPYRRHGEHAAQPYSCRGALS